MWFWCNSELEKSSNLDNSQLAGRCFRLLELCKKIHFMIVGVRKPLQHPLNDAPDAKRLELHVRRRRTAKLPDIRRILARRSVFHSTAIKDRMEMLARL